MQGFTITNGNGLYGNGGGILVNIGVFKHLYLSNLVIENNTASFGGGILNALGFLFMTDVKILNNYATYYGGGVHNGDPSWFIAYSYITGNNVIIKNNEAGGKGGGFYNHQSHFKFYDSEFINNISKYGGGLYFDWEGTSYLENVKVIGNTASERGGGILVGKYTFYEFRNVEVGFNHAKNGGGLYVRAPLTDHDQVNLLVHNNVAENKGGGIYFGYVDFNGINVTIADNDADLGTGIYCDDSYLDLKNTIIFSYPSQRIVCDPDGNASTIVVSNSLIMGGKYFIETNGNASVEWLEGNINQNPQFVGSGEFPYQINDNSPCIDAGSTDTTGITQFDLAGEPRVFNGQIDMGAYEWNTFVGVHSPEIEPQSFMVFPNPAQSQISIATTNNETISRINIYNQFGQEILSLENPSSIIDVSNIGIGLFVVGIVSDGKVYRRKLLVK